MDALALLKADHKKVDELLTEALETSSRAIKKRQSLLEKIKRELVNHEKIEEEYFYPVLKESDKEIKDLIYEAYEEHDLVNHVLGLLG